MGGGIRDRRRGVAGRRLVLRSLGRGVGVEGGERICRG